MANVTLKITIRFPLWRKAVLWVWIKAALISEYTLPGSLDVDFMACRAAEFMMRGAKIKAK